MTSKVKELASKIIDLGSSQSSSQAEPTSTAQPISVFTQDTTTTSNMGDLPKEYKVGVFESKGAPLTFKSIPLEQPKDGQVSLAEFLLSSSDQNRSLSKSWLVVSVTLIQPFNTVPLATASQSFRVMRLSVREPLRRQN